MKTSEILITFGLLACCQTYGNISVIVHNNTSYPFAITLSKNYDDTAISVEQTATKLNAMQKKQVLWIEQNPQQKLEQECIYSLDLSHNNENITGKVSIKPLSYAPKKSEVLYAITSNQNSSLTWQRNQEHHTITLPFHQSSLMITYQKYTDPEKNIVIEYQLQEGPRQIATQQAHQLSVLSWNVDMKPYNVAKNGQQQRAPLLAPFVQGYDVVILSELFDQNSLSILYKQLIPHYPHVSISPIKGTFNTYKQGVVIFSKWPIEQSDYQSFKQICSGSDCSLEKGVLYACINKQGINYHVYGTALQDWPSNQAALIRMEQLKTIKEFISKHAVPADEAIIIAGSLNINKFKSSFDKKDRNEYNEMLSLLGAQEGEHRGYKFTIDPKNNTLARTIDPKEYSDYILYLTDHKKPKQFLSEVCVFKSTTPWSKQAKHPQHDLSSRFALCATFEF